MKLQRLFLMVLFLLATTNVVKAQQQDFGLWAGYQAQFSPLKKTRIEISPEFRFDQNAGNLDRFLVDVGMEYRLFKWVHLSGSYRYILRNRREFFDHRHRFFLNLNLQKDIGKFEFSYRLRYQNQFTDFGVFREEGIGNSYLRHKLGTDINLPKKLTAGIAADFWFATRQAFIQSDNWRLSTSLSWDQSKTKRWQLAFLRDQALNSRNPLTAHILQISFRQKF